MAIISDQLCLKFRSNNAIKGNSEFRLTSCLKLVSQVSLFFAMGYDSDPLIRNTCAMVFHLGPNLQGLFRCRSAMGPILSERSPPEVVFSPHYERSLLDNCIS